MGTWYPQDKAVMDKTAGPLDSYGPYRIAVLPHAGLFFSGSMIRTFFESIPKETEHVIILSPSHYFRMPASRIAVAEYTESETPETACSAPQSTRLSSWFLSVSSCLLLSDQRNRRRRQMYAPHPASNNTGTTVSTTVYTVFSTSSIGRITRSRTR